MYFTSSNRPFFFSFKIGKMGLTASFCIVYFLLY
jgi:hypothetical protein